MLKALIDWCVHRRMAAIVLTLAFAAYGAHAYLRTPIEAFPDVTNVQVTVIAQMPGYAPEEIERQLTIPLERALNGTPGMTRLRSESLFGLSLVTLTFQDDADAFKSRALISERIATADLPDGVVPDLAPNATPLGEIYQFRVVSDRHDLFERRAALDTTVSRLLKQVPGVADVVSFGGYLEEVHVEVDPDRLAAHDLTLDDVTSALEASNLNVGGGFLRQGDQELAIRGVGYVATPDDLREVVLSSEGGSPVTVGDVARLVRSHTPRRGAVGFGAERDTVEGFVLLRRGENPSDVLAGVHATVDTLNTRALPEGMRVVPFYDRSLLVSQTLDTVHHNLLHGFLLIVSVVWLFLRSLSGSLIVATVIPLSLLAAFTGLYAMGLPANLISMGAIDFGILVDGAVVLVENVLHQAQHQQPRTRRQMLRLVTKAAFDVSRPTLYAMAIIIAALIPVFTLEQVEGRIFRPLALTYSFALVGALVFALTIVPALCAMAMRPGRRLPTEPRWIGALRAAYRRSVDGALRWRLVPVLVAVGLVVGATHSARQLGSEFLPELDEGDFVIFVEMPASIDLDTSQDLMAEVRRRIGAFPEVVGVLNEQGRPEDGTDNEGVNMSECFVRLAPEAQWRAGMTTERLVDEIRASLSEIPGIAFNFSQPIKDNVEEAISGVRGKVVVKIFGQDLEAMRSTLEEIKAALLPVDGIVDLDLYRDASVPQLQLTLNRAALAREGISVASAQAVVETALAGRVVTELWSGERAIPVRVRLPAHERADVGRIAQIPIAAPNGARVPMGQVAETSVAAGRASINREANSRTLALKFNIEGRDMGSVVAEAQEVVEAKVRPPDGTYLVWGGEFENQARAMERLSIIVPIALVIVTLLLVGALGLFRSAAAILLTAPFAMTGGVFALHLADIPLSVSAAIGFIALLGQVSLAGLLVVSAIDDRRRAGAERRDAIVEGAAERFRAVLLAAVLAMLGLLPMAVSTGVGSETQRPFAMVIVGGMVTTLLVALWLLPVVYQAISPRRMPLPDAEDDAPEGLAPPLEPHGEVAA